LVNRFRSYGVLTPRKLPFPTDFLRRPYNSVRTAVRHCDVSAPVVDSQQAATRLAECIELLDRWKGQKSLKLNTEKTQLMWLGSRHQLAKLTVSQLPLATTTSSSTVDIVSTANDLDVILDGQLTMARHTSRLSVCLCAGCTSCAGFFPATSVAVRSPISDDRGDTCLSSGLLSPDDCNSVLAGVFSDSSLCRTRQPAWFLGLLATITLVLVSLHWLPVRQRIIYKTAVLVWKCLHDAAPRYLADLCVPAHSVHGRHQLRSTASGTPLVPRTRTATGQRSFAVNGPRTWNSLPA